MNIESIMSVSGQPNKHNGSETATPEDGTAGAFNQLLNTLVAEITDQNGSDVKAANANPETSWLENLMKLAGQHPDKDMPVPDPAGEAPLSLQDEVSEVSISLTEVMAALQSLVNQEIITPLTGQDSESTDAEVVDPVLPESDEAEAAQIILNGLAGQLPVTLQPSSTGPDQTPMPHLVETASKAAVVNLPSSMRPTVSQGNVDNSLGAVTTPVADPAATSNNAEVAFYPNLSAEAGMQQSQAGSSDVPAAVANDTASFAESLAELSTETTAKTNNVSGKLSAQPQVESQTEPARVSSAVDKLSVQPQVESQTRPTAATTPSTDPTQSTIPTQTTATFSVPETATVEASPKMPNLPALQQIVESVGLVVQKGGTEVRLQLQPESLGQVLVQLHVTDGDVSVKMLAETAQAQTLIQENLPQLKAAFAGQGLQIDGLTVAVGSDASAFDAPNHRANDGFQNPTHRQTDPGSVNLVQPVSSQVVSGLRESLHAVDYQV